MNAISRATFPKAQPYHFCHFYCWVRNVRNRYERKNTEEKWAKNEMRIYVQSNLLVKNICSMQPKGPISFFYLHLQFNTFGSGSFRKTTSSFL